MSKRYIIYLTKFGLVVLTIMFLLGMLLGFMSGSIVTAEGDISETTQMIMGVLNTVLTFIFMLVVAIFMMLSDAISEPTKSSNSEMN